MNSSYDGTSISRRHIGKNIYTFTRHVGKLFLSYLPCSVRKEWQEIYPFHKSKHGYLLNLARLGIWWPIEPFLGIWLKLRNCYWNYTLKRANQGSDSHFGLESILGSTRYLLKNLWEFMVNFLSSASKLFKWAHVRWAIHSFYIN